MFFILSLTFIKLCLPIRIKINFLTFYKAAVKDYCQTILTSFASKGNMLEQKK